MSIVAREVRFGWLPAIRVGQFSAVLCRKWKFGIRRTKNVEMKRGHYDLTVLNFGRLLLMRERPVSG